MSADADAPAARVADADQAPGAWEHCVFINCPFDTTYQRTFDAMVFAVLCCGFEPRSALESSNTDTMRMDLIGNALRGSKYSVHDLSRCHGEGDGNLARFNMPLELGMALELRVQRRHRWFALVPAGHKSQRFVSDLAGFDLAGYDGEAESVVPPLMKWLSTRQDALPKLPSPDRVLKTLPRYRKALDALRRRWINSEPPWKEVVSAGRQVAQKAGLPDGRLADGGGLTRS